MKAIKNILFLLLTALFVYGCYTNPVTGRSSLNLVDESTMRTMATQQYSAFLATNRKVTGTGNPEMVQRVGSRLAAAVQQYLASKGQSDLIAGYQWEFNLVENNEANAWCMPGGKVVVYSGILPLTQTEAGLAVVLGHEIAHAVSRHGNERMSQQLAAQLGGIALSEAVATKSSQTQNIFNAVYGAGSTLGTLAYGRQQESEADHIGLIFMAAAGYNPNEAIPFWQRMMAQSKQKPPEFLSTHPSDQKRINQIKGWIPEAMKYYKPHN